MRKFSYSPLSLARSSVGLALKFIAAKFSRTGLSGAPPRESLLSSFKSAYERYAHTKPPERLAFKALLKPYDYLEDDTFQDKHPLAFKAKSDPELCTTTKP
jgi:hypothetical protein